MRPVYMISGGITKFAKAHPDKDFRLMVKEAFDYAVDDVPALTREEIDGSVCSRFSDHFTRQLMSGAMVQDYLGLSPKPSRRVKGGGATGGLCFQSAWEAVASGRMDVCLAMGFETMSRVNTWKGNEFIALASDTNFDYPVGGFYTGYYAMMVRRHMHEFGTTVEQMAKVAVKNHANALHNPYAQSPAALTVEEVRSSPMVATPLTIRDVQPDVRRGGGCDLGFRGNGDQAGGPAGAGQRGGSATTPCGWLTAPMERWCSSRTNPRRSMPD